MRFFVVLTEGCHDCAWNVEAMLRKESDARLLAARLTTEGSYTALVAEWTFPQHGGTVTRRNLAYCTRDWDWEGRMVTDDGGGTAESGAFCLPMWRVVGLPTVHGI